MGEMTKPQARAFAAARGFEKAATKKDSIGVCFCPMDYRSFLKKNLQSGFTTTGIERGKFVDERGILLPGMTDIRFIQSDSVEGWVSI